MLVIENPAPSSFGASVMMLSAVRVAIEHSDFELAYTRHSSLTRTVA